MLSEVGRRPTDRLEGSLPRITVHTPRGYVSSLDVRPARKDSFPASSRRFIVTPFGHQDRRPKADDRRLPMTALDVCYRYDTPPGERELRAINAVREVYGIRRLGF